MRRWANRVLVVAVPALLLGGCGGGGDRGDDPQDARRRATTACEATAGEMGGATLRSAAATTVLRVRAAAQLGGGGADPWAAAEGGMFLATCVWDVEPAADLGGFTCDQVQSTAYSVVDEDGLTVPDAAQCAIAKRAGPEG